MVSEYLMINGKEIEVDFGLLKEVEGSTVTFFTNREIDIEVSDKELAEIGEIYGLNDESLFAIDMKRKKVILDFDFREFDDETLVDANDDLND